MYCKTIPILLREIFYVGVTIIWAPKFNWQNYIFKSKIVKQVSILNIEYSEWVKELSLRYRKSRSANNSPSWGAIGWFRNESPSWGVSRLRCREV